MTTTLTQTLETQPSHKTLKPRLRPPKASSALGALLVIVLVRVIIKVIVIIIIVLVTAIIIIELVIVIVIIIAIAIVIVIVIVTWGNEGLTFGILRGFCYPKRVNGYLFYY